MPALIAIGLSSVGASLYFGMGVVAGNALGLTPLAYLLAGIFFVVTGMTYAEANSLHPERGGSSDSRATRATRCGASSPAGRSSSTT